MYVEKNDIQSGIPEPHLKVITENNDENITTAIKDAMSLVAAYIGARYDIQKEYEKTGANRNVLVVKMVKTISLYNLYSSSNRVNMPESAKEDNLSTLRVLKDIQSEKAQLFGLTRLTDKDGTSSYIKIGGNAPRSNHY